MDKYLCRKQVAAAIGRSKSTIRRYVEDKRLPAPVNPSGKPKGQKYWLKSEIDAYLERLRQERAEPVMHP